MRQSSPIPQTAEAQRWQPVDAPRRSIGNPPVAMIAWLLWLTAGILPSAAHGQQQASPPTTEAAAAAREASDESLPSPSVGEASPSVGEEGAEEPRDEKERQALIAALGAESFAEREAAASHIMSVGADMLPALRQATEAGGDAEVRLRASILFHRVTVRDFEARAEQFLSSKDPGDLLPGWQSVLPALGDHPSTRELFVEISRRYPELAKAYAQTPEQRAAAADEVATAIMQGMMEQLRSPVPADAIALLLVAADPAVPLRLPVERTLLSLVNKGSVRIVRTQVPMQSVYDDLLSRWIRRSLPEHRQEMLWLSMQDNLPAGGALALRTLHETKDPSTLQMALQAVSRFGKPKEIPLIEHLLEDHRPAGDGVAFIAESGERIETRISDVAMAAIAKVHGESLQEFGFPYAREHPNVGFQVQSLGFPVSDDQARKQVRQRIDKLIAPDQR